MTYDRTSRTQRLTQLALLTALALIIFIIEAQIPPLTTIPATGDDLPLTLLVILCAVGAGGLAVLTVQARRRQ